MKYKCVVIRDQLLSKAQEVIEKEVNKLIKDGWKPQGGVSVSEIWEKEHNFPGSNYFTLAQAMIKED